MENNSSNFYKNARRAAGYTQERWAEVLGVSVESVRNYECGKQTPNDDIVSLMAEVSGITQLGYWHLKEKSKLAAQLLPEVETVPLPQAVIQLICKIRDFANAHRSDQLMDIAADGVIDADERLKFDEIVAELEGIVQAAVQLKCAEGGK